MIDSSMKTTIDIARQIVNFTYRLIYCYVILDIALIKQNVFYFRRIVPIYTVVNCGSILQRVA